VIVCILTYTYSARHAHTHARTYMTEELHGVHNSASVGLRIRSHYRRIISAFIHSGCY